MATASAQPPRPVHGTALAAVAVAAGVVAAALTWSYFPNIAFLVDAWNRDPNYSYGYFVVPIALVILWTRRGMIDWSKVRAPWWGPLPLLGLIALRYPLFERNEFFVETATLPFVVAALVLAVGGTHLLRACWPSLVFLLFMIPLPPSVNQLLAGPLQRLATLGSLAVLQVLGLPVVAEGNVIVVGSETLEVARACNGLSMLLSFLTLITATVILVDKPAPERIILLLSAVPIALISNIVRISATALAYHYIGHDFGEKMAHDFAGFAMMPVALLLVGLELWVLSRVFVDVEEVDTSRYLRRKRKGEAK